MCQSRVYQEVSNRRHSKGGIQPSGKCSPVQCADSLAVTEGKLPMALKPVGFSRVNQIWVLSGLDYGFSSSKPKHHYLVCALGRWMAPPS